MTHVLRQIDACTHYEVQGAYIYFEPQNCDEF